MKTIQEWQKEFADSAAKNIQIIVGGLNKILCLQYLENWPTLVGEYKKSKVC